MAAAWPADRAAAARWRGHPAGGAASKKPATDFFSDAELATSERTGPRDRVAYAVIAWGFRLEQSQQALGAVRRPRCHDPPVSVTQCLWQPHASILLK
jgi:hypothetical protein